MVVVLAGGTGGAKLARGMLDVVGGDALTVIANTGDDLEIHGVHVSPDPDLVAYWLADVIDERGWGIRGDTWSAMDRLEAEDGPGWFRLGDRDLALCKVRTEQLRAGRRLSDAHAKVLRELGVNARVLPMSDGPVRTQVRANGQWQPFQEFMILAGGKEPGALVVEDVRFDGLDAAGPTPEVLEAIDQAEVVVVGPSNPVISIGPILALPGVKEALRATAAPVVAVSPFVGGRAVKGPTDTFCAWASIAMSAGGAAHTYEGLLDGMVADEAAASLPTLVTNTLMDTPDARRTVAATVLDFARTLVA